MDIVVQRKERRTDETAALGSKALVASTETLDPRASGAVPSGQHTIFEEHFRAADLAKPLRMSVRTINRLFREEPGVLKFVGPQGRVTLSIPASVAARVYARLQSLQSTPVESSDPSSRLRKHLLKPGSPLGNPLKIVGLRHLNRRVTKKSADVLDRNTSK